MDKIVLDVETSNTFADVGGQDKIHDLKISFVGAYSYNQDKYFGFHEHQLAEFAPLLQKAGLVIGFAINRFDLPVLKKHCYFDLMALERLDLLEEIELAIGRRISLNALAKENLRLEKTYHGLDAPRLYKEGKLEELKNYCLNDVRITKELYDLAGQQGYLIIPDRNNGPATKVELKWQEIALPATLF